MDVEPEEPPPHLGDYPNGAYWSAVGDDTAEEECYPTVSGRVIRFMWDYTVQVPLWDEEGLLPEEPTWLRGELGLSDELIETLTRWGNDMTGADATLPDGPPERHREAYDELDRRARVLVERLRREVGARYEVVYVPW